jgi:hypothetical protein
MLFRRSGTTPGAFPSGNDTADGPFSFRINVLPGDADRDGDVDTVDAADVRNRFFKSTANPGTDPSTQYTPFHDTDGSGSILDDEGEQGSGVVHGWESDKRGRRRASPRSAG